MITIDKNIPFPACCRYPIKKMLVGDSFGIKLGNTKEETKIFTRRINSYVQTYLKRKKNQSIKFTIRTLPTEIRCWRIK